MARNVCLLEGLMGKDPELKRIGNGSAVCNFSVATSEKYQKAGEEKETTDWHSVVCWGSLAEYAAEHLKKGSPVTIIGKIKTRSYEKDGVKKYVTEIVADVVLPGKKKEEQSASMPAESLPF